jgi:hypothetical protein
MSCPLSLYLSLFPSPSCQHLQLAEALNKNGDDLVDIVEFHDFVVGRLLQQPPEGVLLPPKIQQPLDSPEYQISDDIPRPRGTNPRDSREIPQFAEQSGDSQAI